MAGTTPLHQGKIVTMPQPPSPRKSHVRIPSRDVRQPTPHRLLSRVMVEPCGNVEGQLHRVIKGRIHVTESSDRFRLVGR